VSQARGTDLLQQGEIFPIHGQDIIESFEIFVLYLPGGLWPQIDPAPPGRRLRARIGRAADVVGVRPGRIDQDLFRQILAPQQIGEYALGGRRTADIAHADK
jgi:hypothetical protein